MNWKRKSGFTLIEVLIVIAIAVLLTTIAAASLSKVRRGSNLSAARDNAFTLLREARNATISSRDASVYGVHFESTRVVFFKGDTFVEPDDDNREYLIPDFVTISLIDLEAAVDDVIFERLTGATPDYGTIRFSDEDDVNASTTIVIFSTGLIDVNKE